MYQCYKGLQVERERNRGKSQRNHKKLYKMRELFYGDIVK